MSNISDTDLQMFRERAKSELANGYDVSRLRWDDVVEALCKEVARLRKEAGNQAHAALAEPPRNCDRPECKDIQSAMNVYRRECCVDCGPCYERRPGAMREAEWLLAPATEKEGGENEH